MSLDAVLSQVDSDLPHALDRLIDLLRIPSISTDRAFKADCARAADWLVKDLTSLGFTASSRPTPGHPMVVAHGGEGGPHLLFYGHYDVQPVDPLTLCDGVEKPKGFLTHGRVDNEIWTWGNLGYVATGADGDFLASTPADAIVDLVYALDAAYRANATFVMNSKTAGAARKMKDADGRFLWSDGLAAGEPARLMGYPVLIAEDMPDIANNAFAVAFGDFSSAYTIAERPDMRVLRDPFSAKPHVLFYASKRVGGDVSDFAAVKLLKFAVS